MTRLKIDLKAERVNKGLSLDALAASIDVPKSTLARVEGGSHPRVETAFKIADFYGYKVTDIWPLDSKAVA